MSLDRLTRSGALGLTLAALAAPAAADLRGPDTRDAAGGAQPRHDLRSPDVRDASLGRGTQTAPAVTVVKIPERLPAAGDIDWGDAGIGAGGALGVVLLAAGGAMAVVHRRQPGAARRAAAPTG
jgi:hypothetical protein